MPSILATVSGSLGKIEQISITLANEIQSREPDSLNFLFLTKLIMKNTKNAAVIETNNLSNKFIV